LLLNAFFQAQYAPKIDTGWRFAHDTFRELDLGDGPPKEGMRKKEKGRENYQRI